MKKISVAIVMGIILIFCLVISCKKESSSTGRGTCSDGILNQNEVNVDCGGICSKCATCSDGIQNQNETDIDCGGPCNTCPISYPKKGFYGDNLLVRGNDTTVASGGPYSLLAIIPLLIG